MSEATDYIQLTHAASEIDGTIDEVYAARGSYGNLGARITAKQDELTEAQLAAVNSGITAASFAADEAALAEVVDAGAKNILPQNDISGTGRWASDVSCLIPAGDYVIFFGSLSSTDTDATTCQLGFFDESYNSAVAGGAVPQIARGTNISLPVKFENNVVKFRLYSSNTAAHGSGDTVTATNIMICTAADWAVSQKFVPYRPSWQEMWEMIQALQNGTRSAPVLAKAEPDEINKPETGEEEETQ